MKYVKVAEIISQGNRIQFFVCIRCGCIIPDDDWDVKNGTAFRDMHDKFHESLK